MNRVGCTLGVGGHLEEGRCSPEQPTWRFRRKPAGLPVGGDASCILICLETKQAVV